MPSALTDRPIVYLITPGQATEKNIRQAAEAILNITKLAVDLGVTLVQLREKKLSARSQFELGVRLAAVTKGTGTRLLINDRPDIAAASGADGVHLTASSIPAAVVRERFSRNLLIGVSAHSKNEVIEGSRFADLAVYGPVFETPDKGPAKGIEDLRAACLFAGDFPVLALGGVSETNYELVLEAGAAGFAAIRWLNDEASLRRLAANGTIGK